METETTETDVVTETNEGEGEVETISVAKKDYDTLNQTLGSLKKQVKDYKKSLEEKQTEKETPTSNPKPDDALLQRMEKLAFKTAGISHEDDMELARKTAKKWNMEVEDVLGDEDFQVKLKKQQDSRTNIEATSGVRGESSAKTGGKGKSEFWINSNTAPTDTDIETHKIPKSELSKIMAHFIKNKGSNKMFYND